MTQTNERTFLLIKPDAVQRGFIGKVVSRIEEKGLKIVALKMVQVTPEQAARQYACHKGRPFYDSLVQFICSSPSVAMLVEGRDAIALCRKMMGATDPKESPPGTIRGDFSLDVKHNLIHGSDSPESFAQEFPVYFRDDEILNYHLDLERWIYYS
ncbi:MAG: nucleoside-diphosphate kinase [Candidatus Riflebacteria bacterium HGW-Riflebacteria-1]|jgi:nucleoside-diphosphate kinase|nr:MAG: nucleoside-diphosphate kinase [Candidatus Riflebacteria bacterium HGW-Riflebacteria-1]